MRSSKDLAKRLRFDRFPALDTFRRRFFVVGAVAALVGFGVWLGFTSLFGKRQYLPGPVSQNHATFGAQCENCHAIPFASVQDEACLRCHAPRTHSPFVVRDAACRDCHVEHRRVEVFLSVSSRTCVDCHGSLESKRPGGPAVQASITTFAAHPEFTPLRPGHQDEAAIRFNHKLHLTSDRMPPEQPRLVCASCHLPQSDGKLMQPIVFEKHCRRCHPQQVPGPVGGIEAPHRDPAVIRDELIARLLVLGVDNAETIFQGTQGTLPGIRPRPPIDDSRSLREYQGKWVEKLESQLYAPFDERQPLLEHNKYCFLCHVQEGTRTPGELARVVKTNIPARWLVRGEFSHRRHDTLRCQVCHAASEGSERTSDVNLPPRKICQNCHTEDATRSAGTACMLCHLYHDTSKDAALRACRRMELPLGLLIGNELPSAHGGPESAIASPAPCTPTPGDLRSAD